MHYNGANSYLFCNGTTIHKFKAKDSEIVATPLCLRNVSKDFSVDDKKNLACLRTEVDKIDGNKSKTVPVDLAKLVS